MPVEGRSLSSEATQEVERDRRLGNLSTPASVQRLRTALHVKAKEEPEFRFYALYDKIYRKDVLEYAYACCRANKGAAGVDGLTFEEVEARGRESWLGELAQQLRKESYRPEAVRRVYIPKPNGKMRPLGIPTDSADCTGAQYAFGLGGDSPSVSSVTWPTPGSAQAATRVGCRYSDRTRSPIWQQEYRTRVDGLGRHACR